MRKLSPMLLMVTVLSCSCAIATDSNSEQISEHRMAETKLVLQAKQDLAQRLSIDISRIELRDLRAVTWPDSSAGCPQKGKTYLQVLQPGYLIRLYVNKTMYLYHSAGKQKPFLCRDLSKMRPSGPDEFIPPPGIGIE